MIIPLDGNILRPIIMLIFTYCNNFQQSGIMRENIPPGRMKVPMRKTIIPLLVLCFVLTGCSSDIDVTNTDFNNTVISPEIPSPMLTSNPSPTQIENELPDNVEVLYNSLVSICDSNTFCYTVLNKPENAISAYQFSFGYSENPSSNGSAMFSIKEDKKSFSISFLESSYGNVAPPLIMDTLKAAIMYIDNTINSDEAEKLIVDLCSSYDGSSYTHIIEINGYNLLFAPTSYHMEFHAISDNEIIPRGFSVINYSEASLDQMKSTLNIGKKFYLEGIVVDVKERVIAGAASDMRCGSITVSTEENDEYEIIVQYQDLPVVIEIDAKYTFYGFVGAYTKGEPCLWADYIIEIQ